MSKRKTIFKPLNMYEETFDRIDAIAQSLGFSKALFMKQITDAIWDSVSQFVVNGKTVMLVDCRGNQTLFTFVGRSVLKSGSFSMPTEASEEEVDSKVAEKIEKQFEDEKNEK